VITVTAPGKAVLSGEYAVLEGAPAIATAVNRRVRVSVSESPGAEHSLTTPGYLAGTWFFRVSGDGDIEWQEPIPESTAFALVEEVWKSFDTVNWPALAIVVDTQEFSDATTGLKFGLGSSAAVAVALTAALQSFDSVDTDIGKVAGDAHDRFQGGRGSGVDIATSLHGGLIEYQRGAVATGQLRWPQGLLYRFLWSGQAAATSEKLAKFGDARTNNGSLQLLSGCAVAVASAWSTGDCQNILESFPAYIGALRQFSVDHDLGIFDAGHEGLVQSAAAAGVVYKPCGAGGGDIGIVLTDNRDAMTAFCEQVAQQSFQMLDIEPGEQGVEISD
jgi:phosphomevalonate kinase